MKFLHAADIHLDSPLAGLHARAEPLGEELRGCTRRAFAKLIDLAIEEDVAFLVIAGDLYDGDWKDFSTGLFVAEQMRRLARPCFLLRGNHDAESVITRRLPLPPNVHVFATDRCETVQRPDLGVALHGHSFAERAVTRDLSAAYPAPVAGLLNIGVLHTSGDDPGEHDPYAPCRPETLRLKGYGYWALGHIHQRRVLHREPCWIVFPGNLQGRHIRETGAKGASLVTVEDGRVVAVEHRSLDILRWAMLEVDAAGADEPALERRIAAAVADALAKAEGRPLLARLVLAGDCPVHGTPALEPDRVMALALDAAAATGGRLWIEKLRLRTMPPRVVAADTLEPLRDAFRASLEDRDLAAALLREFETLRNRVPAPVQGDLDVPRDVLGLARLLDEAWDAAAAAITAEAAP
ncbi:metallophosphoesterase family protein [Falsiroseomonas sp. CW058]|uniref:metallophosphoesterase family protein n=1 Tax=Falsiroseomonas sp. CW058 TaxID=3388664 RepID=UPI003D319F60